MMRRGYIGPCNLQANDCPFCNAPKSDTYKHFLFECRHPKLEDLRCKLKKLVSDEENWKVIDAAIGTTTDDVDQLQVIEQHEKDKLDAIQYNAFLIYREKLRIERDEPEPEEDVV